MNRDLSPTETRVMEMRATGLRTGEIAAQLGCAMSTVSTYVARAIAKGAIDVIGTRPTPTSDEFRDIPGYKGLYAVTRDGRIWSHARSEWKTPWVTRHGYLRINLYRNGITDSQQAHRLVALAWIPNPYGYPIINHIDGNKRNNHISNLEWCTSAQNNQHAIDIGLNPPRSAKGRAV